MDIRLNIFSYIAMYINYKFEVQITEFWEKYFHETIANT